MSQRDFSELSIVSVRPSVCLADPPGLAAELLDDSQLNLCILGCSAQLSSAQLSSAQWIISTSRPKLRRQQPDNDSTDNTVGPGRTGRECKSNS
ncbi:hypothetical protein AWZ03_011537 [Drosophila navojoa]|uniref:Uncharacterized protein n=1 Tax=Drosophila navojoa TaxID=7232 RepID=A0A484B040_DRONA|nr:hypothetical protein AWZ03_011537 [Drosophila navojoa]